MVNIIELDDSYFPFICEKMKTVSDEYNDKDFNIVKNHSHLIIGCEIDGKIVAFCTLLKSDAMLVVCYTWCEHTLQAKKGFIKGIKYLITKYPNVEFIEEREPVMYKAYLKIKEQIWQQEQ